VAYNEANRTDDALSVCRQALLHVRSDSKPEVISDFYAMIGDFSHKKGLNKEAFAAYDSSLVYNADNIEALNNYAYYLSVVHQQLDKAEEMSYKTVKAEPNNATYLDTYAWILFIKGNYTQARIYIDNAMKNGGESSSDVVEHCGDIHAMTDDITGAVKYWTLSQKLGNKSKVLKQKIVKKKYIKE
jgi:tetratricopeptide (TPR) repeat protein